MYELVWESIALRPDTADADYAVDIRWCDRTAYLRPSVATVYVFQYQRFPLVCLIMTTNDILHSAPRAVHDASLTGYSVEASSNPVISGSLLGCGNSSRTASNHQPRFAFAPT